MDRDIASNATCEGIASAHATASTRATGRGRGMVGQWLQSLLVVWLLLGVSAPAWAADIVLSPGLASTNVGTPYAGSITASGGIAPYSYTVTAGALPAGLVLDAGTGAITGTATAGGIFDFTVTATDSSTGSGPYSGSLAYELVVYSPSMEVGPAGLPDGVVDEPYSVTLVTSGGTAPYSYQLTDGALPPGLSLTPGGLLSGTPTATGTFDFVIYSIDSSTGNGPYAMPRAYSLTVAPAGPAAPIAGAVSATVAHGSGANPITLDLAGGAADTVAVATLPGHGTAIASGTAISYQPDPGYAGPDSFSYTATNASGTSAPATVTITVSPPALALSPAAGALAFDYAVAHSQAFSTSGGAAPYTYALAGVLPAGLAFDTAAGTLSGMPSQIGSFPVTVTATDSSTGAAAPFSVTANYQVVVGPPVIAISPATLADGTAGSAYSQTLAASGGIAPYAFTTIAGTLPDGLQLDSGGTLSGTPTTAGTSVVTVQATDANGQAGSWAYSLDIATATLALAPSSVPGGTVGNAYQQVFTASGGVAPYSYALAGGAPPPGLTLGADGVLSGTPTASGSFMFDLQVTDSSGGTPATATTRYTLAIDVPVITLAPATLPDGAVSSAYSQTLAAGGGIGPYAFALTGGNLPAGMSLAADGTLSGTPTEAGAFPFAVTATDSSTGSGPYSGTGNYTLTIADVAPTANDVAATVAYGSDPTPITLDISGSVATSVVVASAPAHGVATANGLSIDYEPEAGYAGSDSFTYLARNAAGDSAPATVSITVDPPTLALTPAAGTLVPGYGEAYSQAFSASGGAAPYTYALTGALPAGLTFDAASGTLSGTAAESGSFPVTVTATDSSNGTAAPFSVTANYDVRIASATIAIAPATLADGTEGDVYSQTLAASGGVAPYTFELASGTLPAGLQLAADGTLSGTATASGTFAITLRATDAHGQAGDAGYTLVIAEAPPMAVDDAASTLAGQAVTIDVTGNDRGVIDAITVDAAPDHGSARIEGTGVVYTPVAGFFGTDSFRYVASGPGGSSAAATVTVEVAPLPVPSGQPQSLTTLAGETVQFDAATDATGGPFTGVAIVEAPAEGELAVDGTRIDYTPLATADGTVEVRYTLANAFGASEPITATITINPRPIAAAHQANTVSGGEVSVELTDAARGGPFTGAELLSVSPVEAGSASITATGVGDAAGYQLDFSAAADYAGSATVRYTLSNAHATSAAATVSLEIAARADPSRDPEVTGLLRAQVASVRRLARGQMGNFQQRMEQLHGGRAASAGFDNGLSVAIRRQCAEGDWQNPGSTCPRPLHDERAPVV